MIGNAELSPQFYERINTVRERNHGRFTFNDKDHNHYATDMYYSQMHGNFIITAGHDGHKDTLAINSLMPEISEYIIITCSNHLAGIESELVSDSAAESPLLSALPKLAAVIKNERGITHFSKTFQNCYRRQL
jgi:hypothetical protein